MARVRQGRRYPNTAQRRMVLEGPSNANDLPWRQDAILTNAAVTGGPLDILQLFYNMQIEVFAVPKPLEGLLIDGDPADATIQAVNDNTVEVLLDSGLGTGYHTFFIPARPPNFRTQLGGYIAGGFFGLMVS